MKLSTLLAVVLVGLAIVAGRGGSRPADAVSIPKVFVDATATGDADGSSWDDAFTQLHEALAVSGDKEIWVAKGTYTPDIAGVAHTSIGRARTFTFGPGDRVYGGFTGNETAKTQRDPAANPTILSGEIFAAGAADNSYTVVTIQAAANATTILDGVTVRDGNETRASGQAGGVENQGGSPTLATVTITANNGPKGAGLYSSGGTLSLTQVTFADNLLSGESRDLWSDGGTISIEAGHFSTAASGGALVRVNDGTLAVSNSSFAGESGAFDDGIILDGDSVATVEGSEFNGLRHAISSPGSLTNLTVEGSEFADNDVGVVVSGSAVIRGSVFTSNQTRAISLDNGTIEDVLVLGGGAGISADEAVLVQNVTLVGNGSTEIAVVALHGPLTLEHVTLTGYAGPHLLQAGATAPFVGTSVGEIDVHNSIIWDNAGDIVADHAEGFDPSTIMLDDSVVGGGCPSGEGITCSNVTGGDPILGTLGDHGGDTLTVLPGAGGAAIDIGSPAHCPDTDQRGQPRPIDGDGDGVAMCDAGSVEIDPPLVRFDLAASSGTEELGTAGITVSLTKPSDAGVTVDFAVTGGTASRPADFTLDDGTLTFAAGQTLKVLALGLVNDGAGDAGETVQITLSNPKGAGVFAARSAHTLTITEDAAPEVGFAAAAMTVAEKVRKVTVPVAVSPAVNGTVTVEYAVTGGTATIGLDYSLGAGTLSFPAGATSEAITLALKDDFLVEGSETVVVSLSSPTNAALGARKVLTLTIKDNEPSLTCAGKAATIVGGPAADVLTGTGKADVIVSRGGNDSVDGKGGGDTVCAGRGNDTVKGGNGGDTILGDSGNDSIDGGGGNDDLRGGGGIDVIHGHGGNDTLRGEGNPDSLFGEGGKDSFHGGGGKPDRCSGGPGADALLAGHSCEVVSGVP